MGSDMGDRTGTEIGNGLLPTAPPAEYVAGAIGEPGASFPPAENLLPGADQPHVTSRVVEVGQTERGRGTEEVGTSGREDPTAPINSSLQVTVGLDRLGFNLNIWKQNVMHCAVSRNVGQCLKQAMPGTKGDAVALHLLLQKIPEVWANHVAFMNSAHEALVWILGKFEGGANLEINDQWLELLETETMSTECTLEEYVGRKEMLAQRLSRNQMLVTTAKLKKAIIKCLPWQFDSQKCSLTASTAICDVESTLGAIKAVAASIGFNDQLPRVPRASMAKREQGGQQYSGRPDNRVCYFCQEKGHIKPNCPLYKEAQARGNSQNPETDRARAGMASVLCGTGAKGQWMVDTGATNHICNDLRMMSNVTVYDKAKPLSLAAVGSSALRSAQGNVCLTVAGGGKVLLTQVEFVPTASDNLLSVSAAVRDGCKFSVNENGEYVNVLSGDGSFKCRIE